MGILDKKLSSGISPLPWCAKCANENLSEISSQGFVPSYEIEVQMFGFFAENFSSELSLVPIKTKCGVLQKLSLPTGACGGRVDEVVS